jgi:hypothetical protein
MMLVNFLEAAIINGQLYSWFVSALKYENLTHYSFISFQI